MDILSKLTNFYAAWQAGLSASDHLTLLAVGFVLMIGAVAALLWARSRKDPKSEPIRESFADSRAVHVPGERHVVDRQKGDAFLRRIDKMA